MSVIVNDDMQIDLALRLLWREAMREGVIQKLHEERYYVPASVKNHEKKRLWKKTKKRSRAAARKRRNM